MRVQDEVEIELGIRQRTSDSETDVFSKPLFWIFLCLRLIIFIGIFRYELVRCTVVTQLRQMLNEISIGQMLKTGEQRDIQKFLRLLLEHIYYIKPLYELR